MVNFLASEGTDLGGGDFGHSDGPAVIGREFDLVNAAAYIAVNDRSNITYRTGGREGQRQANPPPPDGFAIRPFGFEVSGPHPMGVCNVPRSAYFTFELQWSCLLDRG